MSWWSRIFGGQAIDPARIPTLHAEYRTRRPLLGSTGSRTVAPAHASSEAAKLLAMSAAAFDERKAFDAFEEVRVKEGDGVALDLVMRVLPAGKAPALRMRVASAFDARGQDESVRAVLAPFEDALRDATEAVGAWSLLGEVAERAGDATLAMKYYERAFARDVNLVAIRDRLFRLRSGMVDARKQDAGATMMSDGALTRGRYRVLRELGRGGAGTVFLADDVQLARPVALKVYHKRGAQDRERLVHEARMPASLEHPGIVRILDVDESLFAIAMEAVQGSLKDAARTMPHGQAPVLPWCISVTETVMWLHAQGVVHRDLKPSNFLSREGALRVVLTDFGLAAKTGTSEARTRGEGTPGYMPPEQRRGEPAHPAMDVFALGISFEEMATWCSAPPAFLALAQRMRSEDVARRPALSEVVRALSDMR